MLVHVSFLAVVVLVAYLFHKYQLVSDHLIPFIKRKWPRTNQYVALQSFERQASSGVSRPSFSVAELAARHPRFSEQVAVKGS